MESSDPPYQEIDTVIVTEIRVESIVKLRFLEEWKMDKNNLVFSKQVKGICPMMEKKSETGELLGYRPLFWVFSDEKFAAELKP
jgi:hypothetical protein